MTGECSICLCPFKDPASIPCGHIFCMECIYDCVNAQPAGTKAYCPVCRKDFNIVAPDLAFLPPRYHEYVLPSLRRVYFDEEPSEELESLKSQLSVAQSSMQRSEMQQRQLQQQVDHWKSMAGQAVRQEAQAREQARLNHSLLNEWSQSHGRLSDSYKQLEGKHQKLEAEHNTMKEKCAQLFMRLGLPRFPAPPLALSSPVDRQPIPQQSCPGLQPAARYCHPPAQNSVAANSGGYSVFPGDYNPSSSTLPTNMNSSAQAVLNQAHNTGSKRNSQVAFEGPEDAYASSFPSKRSCMPGPS